MKLSQIKEMDIMFKRMLVLSLSFIFCLSAIPVSASVLSEGGGSSVQGEVIEEESLELDIVAFEERVIELTNQAREEAGLEALEMEHPLMAAAKEKSRDMYGNGYFAHESPTYGSPFDLMKVFGVTYMAAGENIAMGQSTPEEVVTAWLNSPGHRANIMNPNFTHIGVGYIENGHYWTQHFIGK